METDGAGEHAAVWVLSETAPDGTYVCAVHATDDSAFILDRKQATRYVLTVMTACAYAEYDAAMYRQLSAVKGLSDRDVVQMIAAVRQDRALLNDGFTFPLRFAPIFGWRSKQPLVHVFLKGHGEGMPLTEWTPGEARGHAMHVLNALVVADVDAVYRRHLVGSIGVSDAQARQMVDRLALHRGPIDPVPHND
jgi:hypothetical protein